MNIVKIKWKVNNWGLEEMTLPVYVLRYIEALNERDLTWNLIPYSMKLNYYWNPMVESNCLPEKFVKIIYFLFWENKMGD